MPSDPAQAAAVRNAFGEWVARSGKAIVDLGAPIRAAAQVAKGVAQTDAPIGGYSVIEAASVEEAVAILNSHPFVARGGTLQLHEAVSP
jgi:hypothetical protein